jgi:hypothetical protein
MTRRKVTFVMLAVFLVALSGALLRAQTHETPTDPEQDFTAESAVNRQCDWLCQLKERQSRQLEGSWEMIVTPVPASSLRELRARWCLHRR